MLLYFSDEHEILGIQDGESLLDFDTVTLVGWYEARFALATLF
jgi:hypothetical protein